MTELLIINQWWEAPFVMLRCKTISGETHILRVSDTQPRFWTTSVLDVDAWDVKTEVLPSRFRTLQGEALYEVRVEDPDDIREVRDEFYPHYSADVEWPKLARWVYGWKSIIEVDSINLLKKELHPTEIKQARSTTVSDYNLDLLYYDIETEDSIDMKNAPARIVSIAIFDTKTGVHEYATTVRNTPKRQIKKFLASQKALESVVEHTQPIEPIAPDKVKVTVLQHEDPDTNEAALLFWLHRRIESCNPDAIAGQNIIGYDHPYCIHRAQRMNFEMLKKHGSLKPEHTFPDLTYLRKMASFDTKLAYSEQARGELVSSSLAHMATETLGYGKVPRTRITELMVRDPMMLGVYNVWDNVTASRCVDKLNLLEFYLLKTGFHNSTLHNAHSNMMLIEDMMGHLLYEEGVIMPSIQVVKEGMSGLGIEKGGFVMEAPSGVWDHAFEVDNSMEYPSAIIEGNMGPDTKVRKQDFPLGFPFPVTKTPSGRYYRMDRTSIMAEVLKTLAERRTQLKKEMRESTDPYEIERIDKEQRVMKENMNSWYGVLGSGMTEKTRNRPFRLADPEIGSDITEIAREHNEWNKRHINEKSLWLSQEGVLPEPTDGAIEIRFVTLYQDTDSCKVAIANIDEVLEFRPLDAPTVQSMAHFLCSYLNSTFDGFVQETIGVSKSRYFHIKPDAYYRRYFQWGVKKRYAYIDYDGKLGWRGVEIRRSSTPGFVKKIQQVLLETVLTGGDKTKVHQVLREQRELALTEWDETDFGQPFGIRKRGSHAFKSALWSNANLGTQFDIGDKPILFFAKSNSTDLTAVLPSDRKVALPYGESPSSYGIEVDREASIQKFCVDSKSMTRILRALGTTWGFAMSGIKRGDLMEWA